MRYCHTNDTSTAFRSAPPKEIRLDDKKDKSKQIKWREKFYVVKGHSHFGRNCVVALSRRYLLPEEGNPPEQIFASTVKIQIRRASMCEKIYSCWDPRWKNRKEKKNLSQCWWLEVRWNPKLNEWRYFWANKSKSPSAEQHGEWFEFFGTRLNDTVSGSQRKVKVFPRNGSFLQFMFCWRTV